jgi:hypothetical protein
MASLIVLSVNGGGFSGKFLDGRSLSKIPSANGFYK